MAHKVVLTLNVFSNVPLYQQLASEIRKSIAQGRLTAGERLPSIRELSKQLQIASTTVRQSLDLLEKEQIIVLRPGSGAYVTDAATTLVNQIKEESQKEDSHPYTKTYIGHYSELKPGIPWSNEAKRITNVCNKILFDPHWESELKYDFRTTGNPALDLLYGSRWQEILTRWAKDSMSTPTPYSRALGLPELRHEVALWLNRTQDLDCSPDDLIITSGAQHARYLAAQVLIDPGATVVIEEPGNITTALTYAAQNADIVSIGQDQEGVDISDLEKIKDASIIHLMTAASFPSGNCLSQTRAQAVLDWAIKNEVAIVEDAFGIGYYYEDLPPKSLYSLASTQRHNDRVIYLGSLSQLITPGLRLGFAVVPRSLQKAFFRAQWLTERHPSGTMQELVIRLFSEGFFDEHILKVTQAARKRRNALLSALKNWPKEVVEFTPVQAGFHQPVWFKNDIDDVLVFERAREADIGVLPLSVYFRTDDSQSGLSLNFLCLPEEHILEGMEKLLPIVLTCAKSNG